MQKKEKFGLKKDAQKVTRVSTRTRVISKAMRMVDDETRREVRDKRILSLEADNYVEDVQEGEDDEDEDKVQQDALHILNEIIIIQLMLYKDDGLPQKKKKAKSSSSGSLKSKWYVRHFVVHF